MAFVAALTSPSFLALSTCLLTFARAPEVQNHLSVEPGQPAALTCRTSSNITVKVVEWIRPGLDPKYVFLYRNRQVDRLNQHPSFRNRVELKDQQMKDGDVSVTLTNVTVNDTDTSHLTSHSLLTGGGAGDISDGGDKESGRDVGAIVAPGDVRLPLVLSVQLKDTVSLLQLQQLIQIILQFNKNKSSCVNTKCEESLITLRSDEHQRKEAEATESKLKMGEVPL